MLRTEHATMNGSATVIAVVLENGVRDKSGHYSAPLARRPVKSQCTKPRVDEFPTTLAEHV